MLPPAILKQALVLAQTLEEMQVMCTYLQLYRKKKYGYPHFFLFHDVNNNRAFSGCQKSWQSMFSFLAFLQIKINCYTKSKSTYVCDIADITETLCIIVLVFGGTRFLPKAPKYLYLSALYSVP